MVVTNNNNRNPAKDAIEIVDAIGNNSSWDSVYSRVSNAYGSDKTFLKKAIVAVATSRGLDGQKVLAGLEKVFDIHEQERRDLGSEVRVGIDGQEEVVGSAYDPNSEEDYKKFAENLVGQYQTPGFDIGETGVADEGKLSSNYEFEALGKLDDFFGDL